LERPWGQKGGRDPDGEQKGFGYWDPPKCRGPENIQPTLWQKVESGKKKSSNWGGEMQRVDVVHPH